MRFERAHLIFKALVAIDEAAQQAEVKPIAPDFGVRFALAFLFAVSDGTRAPYDAFWRQLRHPLPTGTERMVSLRRHMAAIARSVGAPCTGLFLIAVRNARSPEGRARVRAADAVTRNLVEREATKAQRRH